MRVAGLLGDAGDGRAPESLAGEDTLRGVEELTPGLRLLLVAAKPTRLRGLRLHSGDFIIRIMT
jgi:hypothetical protein